MKKRIIITILILAVLAGIFIPLYLFVFRKNELTQVDASNLIIASAIEIGVIEDYKEAPKINFSKFNTGNGQKNLINSITLPSINNIELDATSYTNSTGDFNYIVSLCAKFMRIDKLEQNKVYQLTVDEDIVKIGYKIINYEVLFTVYNDTTGKYSFISFFYDSSDNEFEYIYIKDSSATNLFNCSFSRYKFNCNDMLSYENYNLNGVEGENVAKAIQNGQSGSSSIAIIDYLNLTKKTYTSSTPDKHFILSNYIYQVYSNFTNGLKYGVELIKDTSKPIVIK